MKICTEGHSTSKHELNNENKFRSHSFIDSEASVSLDQ